MYEYCEEWIKNSEKVDGCIIMSAIHGQPYEGEKFKYCPWCGALLSGTEVQVQIFVEGDIIASKRQVRKWIREYKIGKSCAECGFYSHICALEFHHKDPEEKLFSISKFPEGCTKKMLYDEIDKCLILCSNCHKILHWELEHFKK